MNRKFVNTENDVQIEYEIEIVDEEYKQLIEGELRANSSISNESYGIKRDLTKDAVDTVSCEYCDEVFRKSQIRHHVDFYHKPKTLKCPVCPSTFKYPSLLRAHTVTHESNRERNYACELCDQKFFNKSAYRSHIKRHEPDRQPIYQCDKCEKSFFDKCTLNKHKRQQHLIDINPSDSSSQSNEVPVEQLSEVTFKCRACLCEDESQLFDWNSMVDDACEMTYAECFSICTQLDTDADLPQRICINCASKLKSAFDFIQKSKQSDSVLRLEHRKKEKSVNFKWVSSDLDLSVSEQDEHEDINADAEDELFIKLNEASAALCIVPEQKLGIPIEKCTKERIKRRRLRQKKLKKEEPEPLQVSCNFCNKIVFRKQLRHHIAYYHKPKTLMCHACPLTFKYPSLLLAHTQKIHEKNRERNFSCELCEQKFYTKSECRIHKKIHEDNRQPIYDCDDCEKSFVTKGGLTIHRKFHLGETIECSVCKKHFVRNSDYKVHLRTHTNDLPYKCTICEKAFAHAGQLNTHLRNHEGVLYKCDICDKEYSNQSRLSDHRKEHTGKPLECSICEKSFVQRSRLRRHISGVHGITEREEIDRLIVYVKTNEVRRRAPNGCATYATTHRIEPSEA